MKTKYERLRHAAAIVDGIPEKRISLQHWTNGKLLVKNECGTLACAAGAIAQHPSFARLIRLGDSMSGLDYCPVLWADKWTYGFLALQKVFRLRDHNEAVCLFGGRHDGAFDPGIIANSKGISDKQLFRRRVQAFHVSKGEELENP